MAIKIQVSIGFNSLGLAFRAVEPAELVALIETAARNSGRTTETIAAKLAAGCTLWLDRAAGLKIRGYDANAAAAVAARQDAERTARLTDDGYLHDYR